MGASFQQGSDLIQPSRITPDNRAHPTVVRFLAGSLLVAAAAGSGATTRELSLQDLLNLKVEVASKSEEYLSEAPGVISVISRREIQNFDAVSLVDVFNRAPSMQQIGSHLWVQGKPVMRGFLITHTDHHVLVLINGRPFRDAMGATNSLPLFTSFPVDLIERIEIVRGPGSVLYGSHAMSGVINIVTRVPEEATDVKATAGAGSFGAKMGSATALLGLGDVKISLGGNVFTEDGWDFEAETQALGLREDSAKPYAEENKGLAAFMEYKRLRAQVVYSDTRYEELGLLPMWRSEGHTLNSRWFADLEYRHPIAEGWEFTANTTYNQQEFNVIDALYRRETNDALLSEGSLHGRIGRNARFVAGGLAERLANHDPLELIPGEQMSGIPLEYAEMHYSGYLSADYRAFDPLKLVAGFQYHRVSPDCEARDVMLDTLSHFTGRAFGGSCNDKQALVPRAGGIFEFNQDVALKLLYGRAFRAATPLEKFTLLPNTLYGNPDLEAEFVTTYDAQLFINTPDAQYTFTLYHSRLEDVIGRTLLNPGASVAQTFVNAANYDLYGAELEVKVPLTDNLYATGSATYQREYRDRLFIPDFMGKGGLFYGARGIQIGVFSSLFGRGNQSRDGNPARVDINPPAEPIFLLSLSLKYDFKGLTGIPVTLSGYGTNLFDDPMHYPEFSRNEVNTLPLGPGRAVYGRVSYRFR